MLISSFGDVVAFIRGRRIEMKMTQSDLATRVGVSREWVNGLETGKSSVEFALVLRVLEELQISLAMNKDDDYFQDNGVGLVDLDIFLRELSN